jgi:hypothetical protein
LNDWAEELSLTAEEVRHILAVNRDVHLATPLTCAQVDDLIGLTVFDLDQHARHGESS